MIISFRDPETAKIFGNEVSRRLPTDIQATALRKLLQIHAAVSLDSLRVPPGGHEGKPRWTTFNPHQRLVAHLLCLASGGRTR